MLQQLIAGQSFNQYGDPSTGFMVFRLSEAWTDWSSGVPVGNRPIDIIATFDTDGNVVLSPILLDPPAPLYLPVTSDPQIQSASKRALYVNVGDFRDDGEDRYAIEIPLVSGGLNIFDPVVCPHYNAGSNNFRVELILPDAPLNARQDKDKWRIGMDPSGVAAGQYTGPVTVDALGRVTSAQNTDFATISGDVAAERVARENAYSALSLALSEAQAEFQTAIGYPQSLLSDTYNEYGDPANGSWAGSDTVVRNRWFNVTNLTRVLSPLSPDYARPYLVMGTSATSGGRQEYASEHSWAAGDVLSFAARVFEPLTGTYYLALRWLDNTGTGIGSEIQGTPAALNNSAVTLKLENRTAPSGAVSFYTYPVRSVAGTSTGLQIWAMWANKGTTVNATPLASSPLSPAFGEMLGGRGAAATLAARLANVIKADGSGLLESAITTENIIWDGNNTDGNVFPGFRFGDGRRRWLNEPETKLAIVADPTNTDTGMSLVLSYAFTDAVSGGKAVWFDRAQIRPGIDGVRVRADMLALAGGVYGLNIRYYSANGTALATEYSSGHITATGSKQVVNVTAPTSPSNAAYFIVYISRYSSVTTLSDTHIYCWAMWGTKGNFVPDRPVASTSSVNRTVAAQNAVPSIMWDVFSRSVVPPANTPTVWPDFGSRTRWINSNYFTIMFADANNPNQFGNTIKFDPPSNTFAGWRMWLDEAGGALNDQIMFRVRGRAHSGTWELAARVFSWTGRTTGNGTGFTQIDGTTINFDANDVLGNPLADTVQDFTVVMPVPVPSPAQLNPASSPAGEPSLGTGPLVIWFYMTRRVVASQGDGAFYIYARWAGKNNIGVNPMEDANLPYLSSLSSGSSSGTAFPAGLDYYGGLGALNRKLQLLRAAVTGTQLRIAALGDSWFRIASGNIMVPLAARLVALYGDCGTGWIDAASQASAVNAPALADQTVTYGGTVTSVDAPGFGPANAHVVLGAGNSTVTMSTTKLTDEWTLMWRGQASGADFQYSLDNGSTWSSSIHTNADTLFHSQVIAITLGANKTIIVKQTSSDSAGVVLLGVMGRNSTATGVLFFCLGNGGTQASNWAAPDPSVIAAYTALNPDMTMIEFGTNEQAGHTSTGDFYSNLGLLAEWVHTALPDADVLLFSPSTNFDETVVDGGGNPTFTPMKSYIAQMRQVAVDKLAAWGDGVAMLDVGLHAPSYNTATANDTSKNTSLWYQNTAHLGALGTAFFTDMLMNRVFFLALMP